MNCEICKGQLWVCENHPNNAWENENGKCCAGAGIPCECNLEGKMPDEFIELHILDLEIN